MVIMQIRPEFQPGSEAGGMSVNGHFGSLCKEMINGEGFLYKYYKLKIAVYFVLP